MKIKDRTFVVSGGASGLGKASAEYLHAQGGHVALLDMNKENGDAVVKGLGSEGRAKFFEINMTDTDKVGETVKSVVEWTKSTGKEIGGVVAAAGVATPGKIISGKGQPLDLEGFDTVLKVNVRGAVDLTRQLLPTIIKNNPTDDDERGVIILVSSVAAFDGQPGQTAYSASKGAIASMLLPMARDLVSQGVRVVAIAPGVFESNMTAGMNEKTKKSLEGVLEFPKRLGRPEEFAQLVGEVVQNRMLNATLIRLDGGIRMPSKM